MSGQVMTGTELRVRAASVSPWVDATRAYIPRRPDPRIRWFLDANEGKPLPSVTEALRQALAGERAGAGRVFSRYPSTVQLEELLAARWRVDPARLVVTAGGDDAISRVCMARLAPGSRILVHEPAFEMFGVYARLRGASVLPVRWLEGQPFPLDATVSPVRDDESVGIVTIVSPANPTGNEAGRSDVMAVADACAGSGTAFIFDAAYGEYADDDPTATLVDEGSAYVIRSFSKAYGMAGFRLGYVIAPDALSATVLRAAGMPYPTSSLGVLAAIAALGDTDGVGRAIKLDRKSQRLTSSHE